MTGHHRGKEWARVARRMRPILRAALPSPCPKCGWPIQPGTRFDIDHLIPVDRGGTDDASNLAAAHIHCNRSHGGKAGRAKQLAAKARKEGFPQW